MKKPKSFRLDEKDILKLEKVHNWYKKNHESLNAGANMNNLYKWSEGMTVALLIRDKYTDLLEDNEITPIEEKVEN